MRDKTGREIMVGDTLKCFHFTGPRRKKYYMYKYVEAIDEVGPEKIPYLRMSHLDPISSPFRMKIKDVNHTDWEIVQGFGPDGKCDFEDRPRS